MIFRKYDILIDSDETFRKAGDIESEESDLLSAPRRIRRSRLSVPEKLNSDFGKDFSKNGLFFPIITNHYLEPELGDVFTVHLAYAPELIDVHNCEREILRAINGIRIISSEEMIIRSFLSDIRESPYLNGGDLSFAESELGIDSLFRRRGGSCLAKEDMVQESHVGLTAIKKRASEIMGSSSLFDEISRIYSKDNERKYYGHPVHYLITACGFSMAQDIIDILLVSLKSNKRLLGNRVICLSDIERFAFDEADFQSYFEVSSGSILVIDVTDKNSNNNHAVGNNGLYEFYGKMLRKYGKNTLFIFIDTSANAESSVGMMGNILSAADIVRITEGEGNYETSLKYLKKLINKSGFSSLDKCDYKSLLPRRSFYKVSEIYDIYNNWYSNGLRSHVYRAYRNFETYKIEKKECKTKAYEQLKEMIGLSEIKAVVDEIIDTAKIRGIRKSMGFDDSNQSLHMLFAGNPGTAKTTVARLLSEILRDEGVLENGHLVECGRANLIGKYVGWTAKIVEEKFRSARGGILFIDEAYSLVDDSHTYGDEAINTIVQLMENYRENVIVIFAGYPDKMKAFLEQNEGLNSRISFHLNFPDYSADELTEIMKLMSKTRGYTLSDEAIGKCHDICSEACSQKDYGNGRFVRNMLEQASMRQARRILRDHDGKNIDKKIAAELIADDLEMPHIAQSRSTRVIGF